MLTNVSGYGLRNQKYYYFFIENCVLLFLCLTCNCKTISFKSFLKQCI